MRGIQFAGLVAVAVALGSLMACHDSRVPVAIPATAQTDAATVKPVINFFKSEPSSTTAGQPTSLRWSVQDATTVEIDHGVGKVNSNDNLLISPQETTTYRLKASNAAGISEAFTTVTVPSRAAVDHAPAPDAHLLLKEFDQHIVDVHFAYDSDEIRPEDEPLLQADADLIKKLLTANPSINVRVEGHCDERGSDEFNLGLSDRRATAVKQALIKLGLPNSRLAVVGYGKQLPICTDASETCYSRNRRAHFSVENLSARND